MTSVCSYHWTQQADVNVQYLKCTQDPTQSRMQKLYVIIPGNPGCIQFYEKFACLLCEKTGVPVWGISHTGHAKAEEEKQHPELHQCGLEKQIEHKIDFLKEKVLPAAQQVVLIGHSIGCYIILHIMDQMDSEQITKAVLLFPTIERMRFTPKGKTMTFSLSYARWLYSFGASCLRMLPSSFTNYLLPWFVKTEEECVVNAIQDNIFYEVVDSATFMALHEMYEVDKRDDELIERHLDKLIFYYGATDHWCPKSFYEEMVDVYGGRNENIFLCQLNVPHAFVLSGNEKMADFVVKTA